MAEKGTFGSQWIALFPDGMQGGPRALPLKIGTT